MAQDHVGRLTYEHTNCCVVVACPDDETLWAGGTLLMHPDSCWTVVSLCGRGDSSRADRFHQAMERYGARGVLGGLGETAEEKPLRLVEVEDVLFNLLPSDRYDLVITYGLWGQYTTRRHYEEVAKAVMALRESRRVLAGEIWMFAYDDGGRKHLPRAMPDADVYLHLPADIWEEKARIVHDIYGFAADSVEAKTTPKEEAFWVLGPTK